MGYHRKTMGMNISQCRNHFKELFNLHDEKGLSIFLFIYQNSFTGFGGNSPTKPDSKGCAEECFYKI